MFGIWLTSYNMYIYEEDQHQESYGLEPRLQSQPEQPAVATSF